MATKKPQTTSNKGVIGGGVKSWSNKKRGLIVGVGVFLLAGLSFGGFALWQNLGADAAGGNKNLGTYRATTVGGRAISITGYACKVTSTQIKGTVVVNSGTSGERLTPTLQYKTPSGIPQYPRGNTIDSRAGQKGTVFSYANSINSSTSIYLYLDKLNNRTGSFATFTASSLPQC